jgi:hypothetical protein
MAPSHTGADEPENSTGLTADGIDVSSVSSTATLDDYRDDVDHGHVVAETEDSLVYADHAGYELGEWADDLDMDARRLSERMHELARDLTEYDWCASDPVVLAKEDEDA